MPEVPMLFNRYKETLKLLEGRFESGFPLIYLGDEVDVSSRWSGDGKTPYQGSRGTVTRIEHGIQSAFNRDYLIYRMRRDDGDPFEMWLYTLDLIERGHPYSQLSGQPLFIDDRVLVMNQKHPRFGRFGNIRAMFLFDDSENIVLEVRDETASEEALKIGRELYRETEGRVRAAMTLEEFEQMAKTRDPDGYQGMVALGTLEDVYEGLIKQRVAEQLLEMPEHRRVDQLREQSKFIAMLSDVSLLEQFPPNRLFLR